MKRVAYLTGTRAEFGLMEKILTGIPDLFLLATGMHLLPEFGETIKEVKTKFPNVKIIKTTYQEDSRLSMAKFLGHCTAQVADLLKADLALVLGDRAEQLAMAQAAAYLAIPLIHLHGGETTTTIDNRARNAISQLADWHLPACRNAAKKLQLMGINKHRVKIVGAPGLDQINDLTPVKDKKTIVLLQHPDENEADAARQIKTTLEAIGKFNLPTIVIYPNADAGGREMIKIINQYQNRVKIYPNLERMEFLNQLNQARVLVGNSSAGLIEAPSLNLPAINIGPRQQGREQAKNVINVDYNQTQIEQAINQALKWQLTNVANPYGDGHTAERVIKFLKSL